MSKPVQYPLPKRRRKSAAASFGDPEFWRVREDGHSWISDVARSEPLARIQLVREGVAAQAVASLADVLDMSRESLVRSLGLARATVERKLRSGGRLGVAESERVLGVTMLISQIEQIVNESGNAQGFDAAAWVSQWIESPVPALDGRKPIELMDTAEGRAIVSGLLARMQSGAYA